MKGLELTAMALGDPHHPGLVERRAIVLTGRIAASGSVAREPLPYRGIRYWRAGIVNHAHGDTHRAFGLLGDLM